MTTTPAFEPDYDALESEEGCDVCGWVICVCDDGQGLQEVHPVPCGPPPHPGFPSEED